MLWNESEIIHVYDNLFVVWCAEDIWAWSASANESIDCIRISKYRSISNKMICHFVASFIKWCVLKYMLCDDAYMNAMCCIFFRQKYWKANTWHLLYSHWLRLPMFQLYSVTLAVTKQDIHIKNLRKSSVLLLTRRASLVEQEFLPFPLCTYVIMLSILLRFTDWLLFVCLCLQWNWCSLFTYRIWYIIYVRIRRCHLCHAILFNFIRTSVFV